MNDTMCLTRAERKQRMIAAEPVYGRGEDLFNAVSHIVGGGVGLIVLGVLLGAVAQDPTPNKYAAAVVYSVTIIILYTMSAIYHFLPAGAAKRVFRVFDHCTIFLLIAGSYTPFCLLPFWGSVWGYAILGVEWGLTTIGITFNAINMRWKAVKVISMIAYVVMGWMIIAAVPLLLKTVSAACFAWLLAGGVAYTSGLIFFALGRNHKYMHGVWHVFVLAGTICQFVSILMLM